LKAGGNAIDAAVATAFALSVVEPNASGPGGGGLVLCKMANQPDIMMLDYREKAPSQIRPETYYRTPQSFDSLSLIAGPVVGVPGMVAGLFLLHEKFGALSIEKVLQPAIELGVKGLEVTENFASIITLKYDLIVNNQATAQIYLKDFIPPEAGSIITNPDLSGTMRLLAEKGSGEFYSGQIAADIVKSVRDNGGLMILEDLNQYRPEFRQPVRGTYRGYRIVSSAPPGSGAFLIQLLNIMEGYDLKGLNRNSAAYIHQFAEAMKMVFHDRAACLGDPDFSPIPVDKLIAKDYAATLRKMITPKKARFDYQPMQMATDESGSTSHLSVVDRDGNIVALTQTINYFFGSGITVPGRGMLLNNEIMDFSSKPELPNSIAPDKRPASSMSPTIVFKQDRPVLTIGSPGAKRIISALAQTLINMIDFNMSMDDAIEAPRIHAIGQKLYVEARISPDIIEQLKAWGHKVVLKDDFDNYFGGAQGIFIDPETGILHGGADSRRDGVAVGY
jgi:gamma-glutamyltranspeptidase/glutathione hydrolase